MVVLQVSHKFEVRTVHCYYDTDLSRVLFLDTDNLYCVVDVLDSFYSLKYLSTLIGLTTAFPKLLNFDLSPNLDPLVILFHLFEVELHPDGLQVMILGVEKEYLHGV